MNSHTSPPDSDVVRNRRRNLTAVIDSVFLGKAVSLVDYVYQAHGADINQGELSALQRAKSFGEKKARRLEELLDLPPTTLDLSPSDFARIVAIRAKRGPLITGLTPEKGEKRQDVIGMNAPWPFSTAYEEFMLLPQETRNFIDLTISGLVREFRERQQQGHPRKTTKAR